MSAMGVYATWQMSKDVGRFAMKAPDRVGRGFRKLGSITLLAMTALVFAKSFVGVMTLAAAGQFLDVNARNQEFAWLLDAGRSAVEFTVFEVPVALNAMENGDFTYVAGLPGRWASEQEVFRPVVGMIDTTGQAAVVYVDALQTAARTGYDIVEVTE